MEEQGEVVPCNNDVETRLSSSSSSSDSHNASVHQTVTVPDPADQQWLTPRMFRFLRFRSSDVASEAWSCTVVILTFWFFACVVLMLGFYGAFNLQLGPNCSYPIAANPLFASSVKAQEVDDQASGPILYGFHKLPSLDVETTWSTALSVSINPDFHREWAYYLNAGSRIEIQYDVNFTSFDPLSLVITQGRESLLQWLDNPTYPNTTLSWNIIFGSGSIIQDITEADNYFIAVGNLNLNAIEVYLNITVQSLMYNTSSADFTCYLRSRACIFNVKLLKPNVAVIATPGSKQIDEDTDFYIDVSFGPQWLTYCTGACIATVIILTIFKVCDKNESDTGNQTRENNAVEREPLISSKSDESSSSMRSSFESHSNDDDVVEGRGSDSKEGLEGKITKVGGSNSNNSILCAICFDAPKDCFFIPCGHSAACFTCGSRIAEEAWSCPICRRKIKKVRKIFWV